MFLPVFLTVSLHQHLRRRCEGLWCRGIELLWRDGMGMFTFSLSGAPFFAGCRKTDVTVVDVGTETGRHYLEMFAMTCVLWLILSMFKIYSCIL